MHTVTQQVLDSLQLNKNDTQAPKMKAYMKHHFDYFGISSPTKKELLKAIPTKHITSTSELQQIIDELWDDPRRESQYCAMTIADRHKKLFTLEWLPYWEQKVQHKSWWDSVDHIAPHYLGHMLKTLDSDKQIEIVEGWIATEHLWLQRSALIYQLQYKAATDMEILELAILGTLHNKNFFIRKAAGWCLRAYSRVKPHQVRQFVNNNSDVLSPLTMKEATKYC